MRIAEITMGKDSHRKDVGGRRSGDYHRDLSLDRSGFVRDKGRSKPTDDLRNKLPGKSKSTKSRADEDFQPKNDLRSKMPGRSRVTLSHLEEDLDEPKPNPKTPNRFNLKTMILNNEKHNNTTKYKKYSKPDEVTKEETKSKEEKDYVKKDVSNLRDIIDSLKRKSSGDRRGGDLRHRLRRKDDDNIKKETPKKTLKDSEDSVHKIEESSSSEDSSVDSCGSEIQLRLESCSKRTIELMLKKLKESEKKKNKKRKSVKQKKKKRKKSVTSSSSSSNSSSSDDSSLSDENSSSDEEVIDRSSFLSRSAKSKAARSTMKLDPVEYTESKLSLEDELHLKRALLVKDIKKEKSIDTVKKQIYQSPAPPTEQNEHRKAKLLRDYNKNKSEEEDEKKSIHILDEEDEKQIEILSSNHADEVSKEVRKYQYDKASEEKEYYVSSKGQSRLREWDSPGRSEIRRHRSRDRNRESRISESRTVSIRESKFLSKSKSNSSLSISDQEQKLLNHARNKSKSSSDIKSRLGNKKPNFDKEKDDSNNLDRRDNERSSIESGRRFQAGDKRSSLDPARFEPPRKRRSERRSRSREEYSSGRSTMSSTQQEMLNLVTKKSAWEQEIDAKIESLKVNLKRKSKTDVWCCNFCGIATHTFDVCPESKENGKNPKDPMGMKETCLQCGSYNHLRQDCIHTEERGSNAKGQDGKKFQCNYCLSYDHLTQNCGVIHSERLGKNRMGLAGQKIACDVCNSFNHVGKEHSSEKARVPCCDHCGEFSHSTANCPQVRRSRAETNANVFRWCPLPAEVGSTPCSLCKASHHSYKTCPHKNDHRYGRNPIGANGVMMKCEVCLSYSHKVDTCPHSERNGRNPQGASGKKMQCIYCGSHDHVVNCKEVDSERWGINPCDSRGLKIRCGQCGSYSHLPEKCVHSERWGRSRRRCLYCGSYKHMTEADCLNENDMVRDFLRQRIGYENRRAALPVNRWSNMQNLSTTRYVEQISEEEKKEQIEEERLRLERLRMKFDPNYVPESAQKVQLSKQMTKAGSPATTKPDSGVLEKSSMEVEVGGECVEMVYTEPDESVFLEVDLRTDKVTQPKINTQMQNDIVTALTAEEEKVVSRFKIHITKTDLYGLTGQNWINDKIVEMYMQMIAKRSQERTYRNLHKPRIYCMSTYFFLNLIMRGYEALARWTKDVDIFSFDVILIPIHLEMHWCVAVVDFRCPGVFYYDSMSGHNMPALSAILNYLREEHLRKKGEELNLSRFAKEIVDCPQQENGADCGIFACKVADYISREATVNFSQEDMPYFRKRMIWEIVKQQLLAP